MKFDIELLKATGSLESDEARTAFAAALRVPINEEIAKRNLARTIFMVDNIGPGANATYPIDIPEISAYILPRIGAAPQNLIAVEELNVPTFEVTSSVEWKLRLAREGRINIIERKALSLRNSIVKLENQCAWQMVNAAVTADNTVEGANDGKLTKGALNAGFQHMESMDGYKVDLILVSARAQGVTKERKLKVLVAQDTSGSTYGYLPLFFGELDKILDVIKSEVTLVEVDTEIQRVRQYKKGMRPEVHGLGGT